MTRPFPDDAPVLSLIGNTPLVDLSRLSARPGVRISGKLEAVNPGGSVKDRPALAIVHAAWPRLAAGATLVDATSGNTGIAYALLGRALGFAVHLFMPANASEERKRTFALYRARVTLTPAEEGQDGAIDACRAHVATTKDDVVYADQYANEANPRAHYETTGPEVLAQTDGALTHFLAGIGTGGTLTGVGRYLREHAPGVRVIGLQPAEPLHGLEGLKHLPTSHVPAIYDASVPHEERTVGTLEAWAMGRRLVDELGLALGPSSGAAVAACVALSAELEAGHIVTVLPDGFGRYGSTLYAQHVLEDAR